MSGSALSPPAAASTGSPPAAPSPPQAPTLAPSDYQGHLEQALGRIGSIRPPNPPALQKLPQPAEIKPETPAAGLQNWGTVLAVLGSLLTRAPLTSALRSAAASMQAYHQGNLEGYRVNRLQFSDKLNQAIAENKQELEHYQTLIDKSRFDMNGALAEIQGYAALRHDQVMMQTASVAAASRLAAARMEAGARLAAVNAQIVENERTNSIKLATSYLSSLGYVPKQLADSLGLPAVVGDHPVTGTAVTSKAPGWAEIPGPYEPSELAANVMGEFLLGKAPNLGFGGQASRTQYIKARGAFLAQPGAMANVNSGKIAISSADAAIKRNVEMLATVGQFQGNADRMAALVEQLAKKGAGPTGSPLANRSIQWLRLNLAGDPDVQALTTGLLELSSEYGKVLSTATGAGGTLTEGAAGRALETLSPDMTLGQLQASLRVIQAGMGNRLAAGQKVVNTLTGYVGDVTTAVENGGTVPSFPNVSGAATPAAPSASAGGFEPRSGASWRDDSLILRSNPRLRQQFDRTYGPGAAALVLGQ